MTSVGVPAGASTPDATVQQVIGRLRALGCGDMREVVITEEHVRFALPSELTRQAAGG